MHCNDYETFKMSCRASSRNGAVVLTDNLAL
jgi:hypothetical protein